jgi:hypothetical protein
MTPSVVLGFAAAALVLHIIRLLFISWQQSRKAKSLGCEAVPLYPCKDPLGIGTLRESLAADRQNTLPELAMDRVAAISEKEHRLVTTFVLRNLGRNNIFTIDPKNIQAMLATQFKDFGLGAARSISLHPLLGTGIVGLLAAVKIK